MRKGNKFRISLNLKRKNVNDSLKNEVKLRKGYISNENDFENDMNEGIEIVNEHKKKKTKQRSLRIGKSSKQFINEVKTIKETKQRRFVTTCLIVIFIIILLLYAFFAIGPIFGISLNRNEGIIEDRKIDIVSTDEDIYLEYDNELLVYSNQVLSMYNQNAKKTWEYKLNQVFIPQIFNNDKYMAVVNNSNGVIYLFEGKKEILNKKLEGIINKVYLDEKGNMAVEYSTSGYKKVIGVYNKKGDNLYNTYLTTGAVVDINLFENARKMLVVQTDASSFKIGATISIVDGTREEDNIDQIAKLDNNFIYDLTIQGQNIIMLLDNKITKLNLETKAINDIKSFEESQLLFADISTNYYVCIEGALSEEDIENRYSVNTMLFDNSTISQTNVQDAPKRMDNTGFLNYILYSNHLQVINKWGVEIKNMEFKEQPKNLVVFNNEKAIGLIYSNKIYVVKM